MSYILFATSSGGVQNPMTTDLDAGGFGISNIATIEQTAGGLLGFFGVAPVPQGAPIVRVAGGSPSEDAINAIITVLEQIGVVAV
jgi:L-serine deaminase